MLHLGNPLCEALSLCSRVMCFDHRLMLVTKSESLWGTLMFPYVEIGWGSVSFINQLGDGSIKKKPYRGSDLLTSVRLWPVLHVTRIKAFIRS